MSLTPVYIALGGNLGPVEAAFRMAREQLDAQAGIHVTASSPLYRTPPLGPAGQPDYLNAVLAAETSLTPQALLRTLQRLEHQAGRIRGDRWGARTLDLDIVAFGDMQLGDDELTLPHAEMHRRQFVLRPLCDLAPDWQHPGMGKTARQLLGLLLASGEPPLAGGRIW